MSLNLICRVGHYARHGDPHGRSEATDLGADQGIFGRDIGGGIPGFQRGAQSVYRARAQAVWLRPARANRQGRATALHRTHDRAVAPAGNPLGGANTPGWEAVQALQTQAGFHLPLHSGGCSLAGRDGCAAQHPVRARHQEAYGARVPGVRRPALRTSGGHLGFPPVQPAREQAVPEQAAALDQDQPCSLRPSAHAAPRNRRACRAISA